MSENSLKLSHLLGAEGPSITAAMGAGLAFLNKHEDKQLCTLLGRTIDEIPAFQPIDKRALQDSFGGNQTGPSDDFLVGRGLFYFGEQRRLFLDCTAGHYQMLWGYNHPELCKAIYEATEHGVIWDNHSNIPQAPVKQLARRLVEVANTPGEEDPLDTVLLGVCTGSVACAAALKIQLKTFAAREGKNCAPVMLVLDGNYHGTDMVSQHLRGMWADIISELDVVALPPNNVEALEKAFKEYGPRIAGFWAEPVMMNREAIAVDQSYLRLAESWCHKTGALLCIDEIQTGFWQPEVFAYRSLGIHPDLVITGKGMTAGFHPLSAVIMKHRHDVLQQYDAISTNGSAALPAFVALCSMELIQRNSGQIRGAAEAIQTGFQQLATEFPKIISTPQGRGHLAGLKFRKVDAAIQFHRQALDAGIWTRVHAYHEGHSTLLTKLGLLADENIIHFLMEQFRALLQKS